MSQPRPTERIEMEEGSIVITGETGALNVYLLTIMLSEQACNIAMSVSRHKRQRCGSRGDERFTRSTVRSPAFQGGVGKHGSG
jgi:hypothetical protein